MTIGDNWRRFLPKQQYLSIWRELSALTPSSGWLGNLVVRALDLQLDGCEFDSRPPCCRVTTLGKLFTPICLCMLWWSGGGMSNCSVRGHGQLCLSRQPLRYTALGTSCAPLIIAVPRSTQPSTLHSMVNWVYFRLSNTNKWQWWMWIVAAYWRTHMPSRLAWSEGWRRAAFNTAAIDAMYHGPLQQQAPWPMLGRVIFIVKVTCAFL